MQIGDRIDIVGRKPRGISVELMVRFGFECREAPMLARFLAAMLAVATARALGQSAPPYTNERTPIMTRLARP